MRRTAYRTAKKIIYEVICVDLGCWAISGRHLAENGAVDLVAEAHVHLDHDDQEARPAEPARNRAAHGCVVRDSGFSGLLRT